MTNFWLKFWFWFKLSIFGLLFLYVVIFAVENSNREVHPWFWFGHEPQTSVLAVVLWAFGTGVVGSILIRTTFRTFRQYQQMKERARTDRMQRELDEMKTKAAMLRPRQPDGGQADETI